MEGVVEKGKVGKVEKVGEVGEVEKAEVRLEGQDSGGTGWCPFEPKYGTIVLLDLEAARKTKAGLILPPSAKGTMGIFGLFLVMKVGPGKVLDNGEVLTSDLRAGDVVLWAKADVAPMRYLGHDFFFGQLDQVWCGVKVDEGTRRELDLRLGLRKV